MNIHFIISTCMVVDFSVIRASFQLGDRRRHRSSHPCHHRANPVPIPDAVVIILVVALGFPIVIFISASVLGIAARSAAAVIAVLGTADAASTIRLNGWRGCPIP